ncbi:MAG: hypothetical protein ACRYFX_08000 [Janthinobacterium lividum]
MALFFKILNAVLILAAMGMGAKQGGAMLAGKPEMQALLASLGLGRTSMLVLGGVTWLGAVLMLPPQTFLWGNFLMAASILFLMALQLHHQNLQGAAIEGPFLLLSLLIIYLKHPLAPN